VSEPLPPILPRSGIAERLRAIFPDGTPMRPYLTRDIAASTVFVMLYIGAIESRDRFLAPKHVYRMSDEQAAMTSDGERLLYAADSVRAGSVARGRAWYADTTREPIRDETLRQGLVRVGAAIERTDLPTTSSKPRYTLAADFAALFDPMLGDTALDTAIDDWRRAHLSRAALARLSIVRAGATRTPGGVAVVLPNGDTRRLTAGDSAIIAKAVVEEFAPRFLADPALVWLSESGNKVVARDDKLARSINLAIDPARNLPDIILADVANASLLLVFVEVVATDGPISEARRDELLRLTREAQIPDDRVAFVTAYLDRSCPPLRKNLADLAWNSFVWLASEPESIIALHGPRDATPKLEELLHAAAPASKRLRRDPPAGRS
jgi:hypothetical protein